MTVDGIGTFEPCVKIKLDDSPHWLSHIELTRQGNVIEIEVVKANGMSYGSKEISLEEFNRMADILLTP